MTIFSEGKKREGVGFAVMSDKISNERGLHPNGTEPYHTAGTRQSAQKVLSSAVSEMPSSGSLKEYANHNRILMRIN
jgi:hypothetical protein